jgi:uncharacterized membrane protein
MRTKDFLGKLEHDRVVQAIRAAEVTTSAEIRIYIQRGKLEGDPLAAAQERFHRLAMHQTRDRNAVLIFIAPRAHKFAVVGDEGIHGKCGNTLWENVVEKMRGHFRQERFSDAITDAIHDLGQVLATHFPRKADDRNELSDSVTEQ